MPDSGVYTFSLAVSVSRSLGFLRLQVAPRREGGGEGGFLLGFKPKMRARRFRSDLVALMDGKAGSRGVVGLDMLAPKGIPAALLESPVGTHATGMFGAFLQTLKRGHCTTGSFPALPPRLPRLNLLAQRGIAEAVGEVV